jgi:hypothetical protein
MYLNYTQRILQTGVQGQVMCKIIMYLTYLQENFKPVAHRSASVEVSVEVVFLKENMKNTGSGRRTATAARVKRAFILVYSNRLELKT